MLSRLRRGERADAAEAPAPAPPDAAARSQRDPILVALGCAAVLAAVAAWLIAGALERPAAARLVAGNSPVNAGATLASDISAHNSPTLARNPRRAGNLAIANRIDTPSYSCALQVSFDDGTSWSQTPLPVPDGEEAKCYAPDVAFGAGGTMYLSFVTLAGRGNVPHAAWLVRSEDGGRTLSRPRRLAGELAFQVRLVADPAVAGRLYLTSLRAEATGLFQFPQTGNPIMFKRSDDGGRTWTAPVRISARSRERAVAPTLAVGSRGRLYVLYLDLGEDRLDYAGAHRGRGGPPYAGPWSLVAARSDDGGVTWREAVVDEGVVPTERMIVFLPKFPALAVDRERGRVYAAYQDGRFGRSDVLAWRSDDGARTWSGPRRVNDTPEPDRSTQSMAALDVAPGGRLDVAYYDRRADPRDVWTEVSLQSSYDHGESFTPRTVVSDRAFDPRIGLGSERGLTDLGSRLALRSGASRATAVWTDTRAGTRASGKQDLARATVAFAPASLPDGAGIALRLAGVGLGATGIAVLAGLARRRRRRAPT